MKNAVKTQPPTSTAPAAPSGRLFSRSFVGLLVTQFTVALNDNIFRWLLVPIGKARFGVHFNDYDRGAELALMLGGLAFLLPFILFSGYGGHLADRYSKKKVMFWCKVAEIVLMLAGVAAIYYGNVPVMMALLFVMGAQSSFFSPAKYSSIPEVVPQSKVTQANGWVGMTTMVAVILGTVIGSVLYDLTTLAEAGARNMAAEPGQYRLWISASVLLGVAVVGCLATFLIRKLPSGNPEKRFPLNPLGQTVRDLRYMRVHLPLLVVALASAYYWGLGALAQTHIDRFALPEIVGADGQSCIGYLLAILTLGIGLGSLIAGFVASGRKKVRLTTVPIAAIGLALFCVMLFFTPAGVGSVHSTAFMFVACALLGLGAMGGMFDIPLMTYLQQNGEESERGRVIAATNVLSFTAMLLGLGVFSLLMKVGCPTRGVWLVAGLGTFLVGLGACILVYVRPATRLLLTAFLRLFYRVEIRGLENLPKDGPMVCAGNHVSYLDGPILAMLLPIGRRTLRFMYWAQFDKVALLKHLARAYDGIPVEPGRQGVLAVREARKALDSGQVVVIFPEGGITRHAIVMPFKPGVRHILKDHDDVPVVPIHIGGTYGSIFSFKGTRFFWKWPERCAWKYVSRLRFRRHIVVSIGAPIYDLSHQDVRALPDAVMALQHEYVKDFTMKTGSETDNFDQDGCPPRQVIYQWKRKVRRHMVLADSTGVELTGQAALLRALVLRRLLRKHVLAPDEKNVGILIPPCVPGVLVNVALAIDQRVAVNLNYSVSNDIMNHCIHKAGIRHVVTSRKVLEKLHYDLDCEVVLLEDYAPKVKLADKLIALLQAKFLPVGMLYRMLGLNKIDPDDTMTIIFTSGSTGVPKGVMLSYKNIGGNLASYSNFFHLGPDQPEKKGDSVIGILPFFHSFGFTGPLWTVLCRGMQGFYHTSPLEPRPIAKLCRKYRPTMIVATPTFLRMYTRQMEPDDLSSVELVVSGAERCPAALMDEYERKFGVRPIQGYGVTETSPVVSANIPASRHFSGDEPMPKDESIGFPMPGVSVEVRNLDTGEPCKCGEVGMLWVAGIAVMKGYYGDPEKTREVIRDGWYCTGDLVYQDADNFLFIAGRLSRFSKVGGEMVPHEGLEDALNLALGNSGEEAPKLCVASVPDEKKGEKVVVLYTEMSLTPQEITDRLIEQKLPPLWIPALDAYHQIPEIPLLGTGKLDLHGIHQMALDLEGVS